MVEIRPFEALMYNQKRIKNLARVIAPPYDIISEEEQKQLYHNHPYNIVRLIYGRYYLDDNDIHNKYLRAAMYLKEWINENILIEDEESLYIYEMEFSYWNKINKLKGIIALIKLEYFEKGIIRPHELTFSKPKEDRLKLMKATKGNLSQIYGVYHGSEKINNILEEKSKEKPIIDITDEKGVKHRLWKIKDKDLINNIISEMKDKHIFIADGHHRYETALAYRDTIRDSLTVCKKDEPYNFTSAFLVALENNDLIILPTHRLIRNIKNFDIDAFLEKLEESFELKKFIFNKEELSTGKRRIFEMMRGHANTFCVYLKGGIFYLIKLKDNKTLEKSSIFDVSEITPPDGIWGLKTPSTVERDMISEHTQKSSIFDETKSLDWNKLDVIVCQKLIIEGIFNKKTKEVTSGEDVSYTKNDDWAVQLVEDDKYQLAIFLNPPTIDQVKSIANNQEKMPHKTTYFYPKPVCGLIMYKLY